MDLTAAITVRRSGADVYEFWHQLENLPAFMAHLQRVRRTGERTSRWTSSAILGRTMEWDAELTDDVPGERIRWRATGDVSSVGEVRLVPAPADVGTEVHARLRYDIPDGPMRRAITKYFGDDPHEPLLDALRRMKQLLETGEVTRSDGAPWGRHSRVEFPQHPARPLTAAEFAKGPPA